VRCVCGTFEPNDRAVVESSEDLGKRVEIVKLIAEARDLDELADHASLLSRVRAAEDLGGHPITHLPRSQHRNQSANNLTVKQVLYKIVVGGNLVELGYELGDEGRSDVLVLFLPALIQELARTDVLWKKKQQPSQWSVEFHHH
jgi:hypothetical protein